MLCILNPILPPFWKITKILMEQKNMMSLTNDVHWNVCHLKSKVWKSQRFENQVFFMLLLYQMMNMCCWPLKANGWKQLCKCQSLHSLIWGATFDFNMQLWSISSVTQICSYWFLRKYPIVQTRKRTRIWLCLLWQFLLMMMHTIVWNLSLILIS